MSFSCRRAWPALALLGALLPQGPARAGVVVLDNGEVLVGRLDPRDVQAALGERLTLPQVYASTEHLHEERRRYADGLERIAAEFARAPAGVPADRALARARWSNFYLGYQGEDDRTLQTRYGDWLAGYIDSIDPDLRAPLRSRAQVASGPQMLRSHSGNAPRSAAICSEATLLCSSTNCITSRPSSTAASEL